MCKRIIFFILMALLAVSLVGCGKNDSGSANTENTSSVVDTANPTEEISESQEEANQEVETVDMEQYLLDKGVLSGTRTETAAEMIGALKGFKYIDSGIEIYEYDTNSENYKKLANGESIEISGMEGFSMSATAVNGKYVLFCTDEPNDAVISAFKEYK